MRHLISLGNRCDVAFQLRMHGEENVSHFFDWLATPPAGLIKIIKADFNVFFPENLALCKDGYVYDKETGVNFYHQFPLYNGRMPDNFLLFYEAFNAKFEYLARRFRDFVRNKPVTLVRRGFSEDKASELEKAFFTLFPKADAQFLYVISGGHEFKTGHGHARRLESSGSLGDPVAWSALLKEEHLIKQPYRRATAEILLHAEDDYSLAVSNRFSEAQLRAAAESNLENPKFLLELSQYFRVKGQWSKAIEAAGLALERFPVDPDVIFELTLCRWKGKQISAADAAQIFLGMLDGPRQDPAWLFQASTALLEAGDIDKAISLSERSVRASPLNPHAHLNRAACMLKSRCFAGAEASSRTAIQLRNTNAYFHSIQAKSLSHLGRHDDAIIAARRAYELNKSDFYRIRLDEIIFRANSNQKVTTSVKETSELHV